MGDRRQAEPSPTSPARTSWGVVFLGVAIVVASTAVALAIIFTRGNDSSVGSAKPQEGNAASAENAPVASTSGSVEAGRYVQAGSFKAPGDAESERQRLTSLGIETQLIASDQAEELYPGFQVLVVGPIQGRGEEGATVNDLRHHGVPTAFARDLTPAVSNVGYGAAAGDWSGTLEEISSAHPRLNRKLTVIASFESSGRAGQMEVSDLHCRLNLTASGSSGTTLSFNQDPTCLGSGIWRLRPSGSSLMVTLLPPENDLIFLGTLNPA